MKDTYIMPWGKFKGKRMIDIPADYLLWLYSEGKCSGAVKQYIDNNLDVLKTQRGK